MVAKKRYELDNTLFHRYYSRNVKTIIFRKITNHTKFKQTNVPSHLHISSLNFGKANYSFLYPFQLRRNTFSENPFKWETKA